MLEISIKGRDLFFESTNSFYTVEDHTLQLEHSLVSLSKWESKWCKPFLDKEEKTLEETLDYIRCMTLTENVDPMVYRLITDDMIAQVNEYIAAPMTATWFNEKGSKKPSREIITNELIYYWMISLGIPIDYCDKWHLNRLLTLIRVFNAKNQKQKPMSKRDLMNRNAALNAARRQKLNSKG